MSETEVFRPSTFYTNKCYAFALSTRKEGWPNERFFTTHPLTYLGKYLRTETWGSNDGGGRAEIFEEGRIEYNMKELRVLWKFLANKVVEKENQKNPEEMQNQERPKEGRASGRQPEKHMEVVFACQIIKE